MHGAELGPFGLQETFDHPGKGAGQDDQGALAQGVGEEQGAAVSHLALDRGQGQDHRQHRGGAGRQHQAEQRP